MGWAIVFVDQSDNAGLGQEEGDDLSVTLQPNGKPFPTKEAARQYAENTDEFDHGQYMIAQVVDNSTL